MLSDDKKKQRRLLIRAKSKVRQFESQALRAEQRAAFWRRRVADIQFEQRAAYQPPLWPAVESEGAKASESDSGIRTADLNPQTPEL